MENTNKTLPPHLQNLARKLQASWDEKAIWIDATPEGYGPDEPSGDPPPCEHKTVEQQRLNRAILEGRVLLNGRLTAEKRQQIERAVANAEARLV